MGKSQSKQAIKSSGTKRLVESTKQNEVDMAVKSMFEKEEDDADADLKTTVEVNLVLRDLNEAGHYFVVASERVGSVAWVPVGSTETSALTDSPNFMRTFQTGYCFESPQRIKLDLYMAVEHFEMPEMKHGDEPQIPHDAVLVQSIECPLAEAVAGQGSCLSRPVGDRGTLTMFVEELKKLQTNVSFDLRIEDVDVSRLPNKTKKTREMLFSVFRGVSDGIVADSLAQVIKTEGLECPVTRDGYIKDQVWSNLKVSVNALCRGDPSRPIVIDLVELGGPKGEEKIGECVVTFKELEAASIHGTEVALALTGTPGKILVQNIAIERCDSFMDYIAGGLSLNLFIAVDFTKSNKDPSLPESLHSFANPRVPNDYVRVIRSVVDILQFYDNDKRISVYGFGAKLPPTYSHTSHCFACNGNFFDPEVVGIDEILRVYQEALEAVVLHGPTNFHDIVRLVADFTEPYADPRIQNQKYSVLLILTDGVITDMKQTINEIVRAAEFPMSIVVVGIGDEDFGLMKILDADDQKLYSTEERRFASRDIVQFVEFNKFRNQPLHVLASETLAEIPREVVAYFKSKDMVPNPKVEKDPEAVDGDGPSDIEKQLQLMKAEFMEEVTKAIPDVDEFEVYKIITEEKIPSRDIEYFREILAEAPRGKNVLTMPKPANIESLGSLRTPKSKASPKKNPSAGSPRAIVKSPSVAPIVDLASQSADESPPPTDARPVASPRGLPREELAKMFSVADMLQGSTVVSPRQSVMMSLNQPGSPAKSVRLDLTKPVTMSFTPEKGRTPDNEPASTGLPAPISMDDPSDA